MFDYHIHSNFSADCDTPMEETIEAALKKGLKEVCFTEHIDEDYPDPTIHFELDLPAYEKKIKEMQCLYKERINIKKGLEIGVQPHLLDNCKQMIQEETFDFIICSMHTTSGMDLHSGAFFQGKTVDEAYQAYYQELLDCITHFKDFQVLGHIDLIKRYTQTRKNEHSFLNLIEEIFQEIIPEGKGIEINTSGFRYGLNSAMPSKDILKLYKECGGEIITIGSDSHQASTVGYGLAEAIELLRSLGFSYITTFKGKQPVFHHI
ncbi:histidinol-phosphatase HisJ family protein [Virgibacillus salarius]|uniref:histidinol-phosphatase HisJ family protein n=1 Tax=Virgibacillus salarius TaxID=447199 RepID=UPI0024901C75|nr:histidinol-phosphatase HisJ family protein [Virgibacillus salarius]WBX80748.1 histidinol-phosphatase HisJ family protein [Virgibacillus salarius]